MFFPPGMPRTKRLLDLLVSVLGLLALAPLLLLIAVLIRILLGTPFLFRQPRTGYKGRVFQLYKFRTMSEARDADGTLLPDARRLGLFGKTLRVLSLDELPELLNILRGEMSLVGPRPLLPEYLPLYSPEQARRHDVHPGLTGWAQVQGRNALTWPEKFRLDVWYVDHRTFPLDLRILLLTPLIVFGRKGISQSGRATTDKFPGNT
ncbi:MAG TPA: sugar transferase [Anaerolineales bacterium]|jgi:lipopolysaccharide/colanic/teichoic acid biosynthesis glycosyltransferase